MVSHMNSRRPYTYLKHNNHDSKTHDFVRFSANTSEQQVHSVSALEPLHQGQKHTKKSQGRERTSALSLTFSFVVKQSMSIAGFRYPRGEPILSRRHQEQRTGVSCVRPGLCRSRGYNRRDDHSWARMGLASRHRTWHK